MAPQLQVLKPPVEAAINVDPAVEASVVARLRSAGCVFAEDEARLLLSAGSTPAQLEVNVRRRVAGFPLEQILGWAEFCGLRMVVEPGVFVPRRRTELLVREAVSLAHSGAVVVDLCCGSGAVGAAMAGLLGAAGNKLRLYAADIDEAAVRCARRNVPDDATVLVGDLFEPLPRGLRGSVDLLVANAPYVPSEGIRFMPSEARIHEPRVALDGGAEGVDILRRIIAAAPAWLAPGGYLLFESSDAQAHRLCDLVARAGLTSRVATSEELDATVIVGSAP